MCHRGGKWHAAADARGSEVRKALQIYIEDRMGSQVTARSGRDGGRGAFLSAFVVDR